MTDTFPITIYHNPNCGTSRNVVARVRSAGYTPVVVEYLKTGWTRDQLTGLFDKARLPARAFLRDKGTPAAELGLLDPGVAEATILDAMIAHPILVNRPLVETPLGVRLCRPPDAVLPLLEHSPQTFTKKDAEVVRGRGE